MRFERDSIPRPLVMSGLAASTLAALRLTLDLTDETRTLVNAGLALTAVYFLSSLGTLIRGRTSFGFHLYSAICFTVFTGVVLLVLEPPSGSHSKLSVYALVVGFGVFMCLYHIQALWRLRTATTTEEEGV